MLTEKGPVDSLSPSVGREQGPLTPYIMSPSIFYLDGKMGTTGQDRTWELLRQKIGNNSGQTDNTPTAKAHFTKNKLLHKLWKSSP